MNLLTLKRINNLDEKDQILYHPYKNIVQNFFELAIKKEATNFDIIERYFSGIESAPDEIKYYYESMLGITSYYQHSQGGKGKYIEKMLSSYSKSCIVNFELKKMPVWFDFMDIYKKKGLYSDEILSVEEKKQLRLSKWQGCSILF